MTYDYLRVEGKSTRIILHVLFWMISWAFLSWFFTRLTHEYRYTFVFTTLLLIIAILTTWFLNYFLIPRYLLKKRYWLFAFSTIFTGLISLWLEILGILWIFLHLLTKYNTAGKGLPFFIDPVFLVAGLYFVVFAGVMIRLIRISFSMQAEKLSLQNLKLEVENKLKESELSSMRTQFHPHFLFNTLNNLYWLTLNKSEQAPQLVLKLSDLLDYSLYRCNCERVPLDQEIGYIQNYLDIMKIRFQDKVDIRFGIYGQVRDRLIAPYILITLVENACKHGISQLISPAPIDIMIEIRPESMQFTVSNTYSGDNATSADSKGIGLQQLNMRLGLIYPDKHEFQIQKFGNRFQAQLIIYDWNTKKNTLSDR